MRETKNRRHVRTFGMLDDNHLVGKWLIEISLRTEITAQSLVLWCVTGFG